jgi:hypothetical protein
MTVSILVTSLIFLVGFSVTEFVLVWPLWFQLVLWVTFATLFPIFFYRYSRALWVALIHLGGAVFWDNEPYIESDLSIVDAFLYRPPQAGEAQEPSVTGEDAPTFPKLP